MTAVQRDAAEERIVPGTEHWDDSYPDHIQRYRFALRFVEAGAPVLDAGCGAGYGAAELADGAAARVVAVDIDGSALELARRHFDRPGITWIRDDCHALDTAARYGPFAVITNFENIEHLARPADFVARAAALLRPDGVLLTSTPNRLLLNALRGAPPDAPPTNPHHLHEFSEDEFRSLLRRHFDEVRFHYQSPSGAAGLRLRLRSLAGRLRLLPLLRFVHHRLRRQPSSAPAARRTPRGWTIHDTRPLAGVAWTIIAVCRGPRAS